MPRIKYMLCQAPLLYNPLLSNIARQQQFTIPYSLFIICYLLYIIQITSQRKNAYYIICLLLLLVTAYWKSNIK